MRASHIVGLLLGLGSVTAFVGLFGAGCGSSKISGFDDPNAQDGSFEGGGPTFVGGGDAGPGGCTGLRCQQKVCSGGGDTTVTGTVYAPNGKLPLYNAIVYVPNATPDALTKGATCDKCGAVTGDPVVTAVTDSKGQFTLKNVPVGANIPLVVQIGKWRRQVVIPTVTECSETKITDPEMTRLPKKQSEGDMPQMALTTGGCDKLGCMLPKIGIDPSEFGVESDGPSKAVHTYVGAGAPGVPAGSPPGAPSASVLWSDLTKLMNYDLAILSCECDEHLEGKGNMAGGPDFDAVAKYLTAGGRIFTTDFMYTWYRYSTDDGLKTAASWRGGAPIGGSPMSFDSSFPKGMALVDWLQNVGATTTPGSLSPDVVWSNIISLDNTKTQAWATSANPNAGPRVFTVNVPVGVSADQQCGKGVHIDAHINQEPPDVVDQSYPAGCNTPLKPGENLLAFFFFDLASCIQNDADPPKPPVVK
jgi:hypothetical protein